MLYVVGNISKGIYWRCTDPWTLNSKFCVCECGNWKENHCVRHRTRLKLPWVIYFRIYFVPPSERTPSQLRKQVRWYGIWKQSLWQVSSRLECACVVPDISRQCGCLIFQGRFSPEGETTFLPRNVRHQSDTRHHIPEEWRPHLHRREDKFA